MDDKEDIENLAKDALRRRGVKVISTKFIGEKQVEFSVVRDGYKQGRATVLFDSDLTPHIYQS